MGMIVSYNRGAQASKPHLAYGEDGQSLFTDFNSTLAKDPVVTKDGTVADSQASALGSVVVLDQGGSLLSNNSGHCFRPADGVVFSGAARAISIFGANDTVNHDIGFSNNADANPAESIGFTLTSVGDGTDSSPAEATTVVCRYDDGSTDSSVTLASTQLPDSFSVEGFNEYRVLVECEGGAVVAKYFVNGTQVAEINKSGGAWAAAGLKWAVTNLTGSATHDIGVDWISLGSNVR
tara:strand:+ start:5314 stop:6021 length:708 start_codon:yes stop_codon:yes gene_type:complete